jgi:branched-chain amino acid transport system substrate-binding protein
MKRNPDRIAALAVLALTATTIAAPPPAQAADPIRIGVIAEVSSLSGAAIPQAAKLAADEINAAGGVDGRMIEIVEYDDHNSAADAVRAFQRAANQDKVHAVIASYVSEVVLALQPWSGRLKMPMITPGAASDVISKRVHDDYDHLKYTFHGYLASTFLSDSVCDGLKVTAVDTLHMKTAVVMSEDAAWTIPLDAEYLKCLPKIGIQVLDHIRLSPDTTDFTPIFNKIEGLKPDVIVTGISHVGVQPTVQWHDQQVPIPMMGISSQATTSSFYKDTNGATEGVIYQTVSAPEVAVTPKMIPFTNAFVKRYGVTPAYCGYTSYDEVYYIADAIKRAGSTDPDKLVDALEKTSWNGTIGKVEFYGREHPFTHAMKVSPEYVSGLLVQWQGGKQKTVWPTEVANAKMVFPSFVKLPGK